MSITTSLLRDTTWSLFVDGENFTKRGTETLHEAGVKMRDGPFRKDVYLWLPRIGARNAFFGDSAFFYPRGEGPSWTVHQASRAYYYASTTSDEPEWTDTRRELRELGFEARLHRRIRGRSKAVDISLATEALLLAAESRTEVSVIFSGDGDYVPLVEAMKRIGQRVIVGGFATSTNSDLIIAADDYIDLTDHLVGAWQRWTEHLDREAQIAAALAREAAEEGAGD